MRSTVRSIELIPQKLNRKKKERKHKGENLEEKIKRGSGNKTKQNKKDGSKRKSKS
jgi:hypothetical protein